MFQFLVGIQILFRFEIYLPWLMSGFSKCIYNGCVGFCYCSSGGRNLFFHDIGDVYGFSDRKTHRVLSAMCEFFDYLTHRVLAVYSKFCDYKMFRMHLDIYGNYSIRKRIGFWWRIYIKSWDYTILRLYGRTDKCVAVEWLPLLIDDRKVPALIADRPGSFRPFPRVTTDATVPFRIDPRNRRF